MWIALYGIAFMIAGTILWLHGFKKGRSFQTMHDLDMRMQELWAKQQARKAKAETKPLEGK